MGEACTMYSETHGGIAFAALAMTAAQIILRMDILRAPDVSLVQGPFAPLQTLRRSLRGGCRTRHKSTHTSFVIHPDGYREETSCLKR